MDGAADRARAMGATEEQEEDLEVGATEEGPEVGATEEVEAATGEQGPEVEAPEEVEASEVEATGGADTQEVEAMDEMPTEAEATVVEATEATATVAAAAMEEVLWAPWVAAHLVMLDSHYTVLVLALNSRPVYSLEKSLEESRKESHLPRSLAPTAAALDPGRN